MRKTMFLTMAAAALMLLAACTVVNIETAATVGSSTTHAKVDGSAWAEVSASSEATTDTARSAAGRSHPVSEETVSAGTVLGLAAIGGGAGTAVAGPAGGLAGAGIGTLAGEALK